MWEFKAIILQRDSISGRAALLYLRLLETNMIKSAKIVYPRAKKKSSQYSKETKKVPCVEVSYTDKDRVLRISLPPQYSNEYLRYKICAAADFIILQVEKRIYLFYDEEGKNTAIVRDIGCPVFVYRHQVVFQKGHELFAYGSYGNVIGSRKLTKKELSLIHAYWLEPDTSPREWQLEWYKKLDFNFEPGFKLESDQFELRWISDCPDNIRIETVSDWCTEETWHEHEITSCVRFQMDNGLNWQIAPRYICYNGTNVCQEKNALVKNEKCLCFYTLEDKIFTIHYTSEVDFSAHDVQVWFRLSFYKALIKRAEVVLTEELHRKEKEISLYSTGCGILYPHNDPIRKLGYCDEIGTIWFNPCLILLPFSLREEVIVHELCHTKHFNHSQKFRNLVEQKLGHPVANFDLYCRRLAEGFGFSKDMSREDTYSWCCYFKQVLTLLDYKKSFVNLASFFVYYTKFSKVLTK